MVCILGIKVGPGPLPYILLVETGWELAVCEGESNFLLLSPFKMEV